MATKQTAGRGPKRTAAARRRTREEARLSRLALMLSLEVRRLLEDITLRRGLLLDVWSKMRARAPLVKLLRTRWEEVPTADLLLLPEPALLALDRFYRGVDEFRLYVETTQDMPRALQAVYANYAAQLEVAGIAACNLLDDLHGEVMAPEGARLKGGELLEGAPGSFADDALLEFPLSFEADEPDPTEGGQEVEAGESAPGDTGDEG